MYKDYLAQIEMEGNARGMEMRVQRVHPSTFGCVCVSNPNVWPKNGKQKQEQNKQTFRRSLSS